MAQDDVDAQLARLRKSCRHGRAAARATGHRTGDCRGQAGTKGAKAMIDLTTTYLGLALKKPYRRVGVAT